MNRQSTALGLLVLALGATDASAHHVMGGRMPSTFAEGILSGIGHPKIGLDHFAAVVAVGCLAATGGGGGGLPRRHAEGGADIRDWLYRSHDRGSSVAFARRHHTGRGGPGSSDRNSTWRSLDWPSPDADWHGPHAFCSRRTRARLCVRGIDIWRRANANLCLSAGSCGGSGRCRACCDENCSQPRRRPRGAFAEACRRRYRRRRTGSSGPKWSRRPNQRRTICSRNPVRLSVR